ncbi:MAG: hypothetical protein JNK93_06640 [Planctomycetia bacterium]|nr:hypothetical protein [Planctomycetia bacterium]
MWLVRYGRSAFVGAFAADRPFVRGDRVTIDSPRGRELGEVLGPAPSGEPDGRIVRLSNATDEAVDARPLLDAAIRSIEPYGALVLDCEILLDGTALLHVIAWEPVDLDATLAELSTAFGRPVRLLDVSRSPVAADPTNCGKPNCGSGGCGSCSSGGGCGTSSCSRGVAKSSEELTAQFRDLREAMERDALAGRRELL